jgi:hypothetical protein
MDEFKRLRFELSQPHVKQVDVSIAIMLLDEIDRLREGNHENVR